MTRHPWNRRLLLAFGALVLCAATAASGRAPAAQAAWQVDVGSHLEAFAPNGMAYGLHDVTGTVQILIVNTDPHPNGVAVQATTACGGPCGVTAQNPPSLTADDGCGTDQSPVVLAAWSGTIDATDSCTITYTLTLTGQAPGDWYVFLSGVSQLDPNTLSPTGGTGFMFSVTIPTPDPALVIDDQTIDPATGDLEADGSYQSAFAQADVEVTKLTSTGATRVVRHFAQTTGTQAWRWRGRNDAGHRVAPGTYRVRVTVGLTVRSHKIIVRS